MIWRETLRRSKKVHHHEVHHVAATGSEEILDGDGPAANYTEYTIIREYATSVSSGYASDLSLAAHVEAPNSQLLPWAAIVLSPFFPA